MQSCYKEALDNIQELKALGDLPEFIVDISGGSQDVVQLMIQNPVVWHKSCRNDIDKQKVERARKRKKHEESVSPVKTRRMRDKSTTLALPTPSTSLCEPFNKLCLFCGEVGNKNELRRAATLGLDRKVKECAKVVGDKHLLAELAAGDMVAVNAVYHRACLTRLYRKAETVGCDSTGSNGTQIISAHVLNELLEYIKDYHCSGVSLAMSDLTAIYDERIADLGFPTSNATPHAFRRIPKA